MREGELEREREIPFIRMSCKETSCEYINYIEEAIYLSNSIAVAVAVAGWHIINQCSSERSLRLLLLLLVRTIYVRTAITASLHHMRI